MKYEPANALDTDKLVTSARIKRDTDGTLTVIATGEQRVGLSRTLTQKTVDATGDTTNYKRTWETIWDLMNSGMAFQSAPWDNYDGLLGSGGPDEAPGGGGGG